jgi:hypothetical protein
MNICSGVTVASMRRSSKNSAAGPVRYRTLSAVLSDISTEQVYIISDVTIKAGHSHIYVDPTMVSTIPWRNLLPTWPAH